MEAEERAGNVADQTGAHVADRAWLTRQIADQIRAAETEAWNAAVEACLQIYAETHINADVMYAMSNLKKEPTP